MEKLAPPKMIMERLAPPETQNFPFDWSQWQEMKVEAVGKETEARKGCWLTLYYDPEYSQETLNRLQVKTKMPFEVMLKMDYVQPEDLRKIFQETETPERLTALATGIRLKNQTTSQDKKVLAYLFQKSIQDRMAKASFNFFWHGWASDARVWHAQQEKEKLLKENIELRSTGERPVVNIIPDGMGIKGGCRTQKADGKEIFTPKMYGQQMAEFINLFGWDRTKDIFGHSMGGIGALWLALEIINNPQFRTSEGKIPYLKLWLLSPAYPANANVFIQQYLDISLKVLKKLPRHLRTAAAPITMLINNYLLPNSPDELHKVHTDVITQNPATVIQTMDGLAWQDYFTPEQWHKIISHFPVTINTTPEDRLVDEKISNTAFNDLTAQVRELPQTPIIEPLILSGKGDHYLDAMAVGRERVLKTLNQEEVVLMAAPRLLPWLYDQIPQAVLPEVVNILVGSLYEMHNKKREDRRLIANSGIQKIIDKVKEAVSLPQKREDEMKILLKGAFAYHSMLWR